MIKNVGVFMGIRLSVGAYFMRRARAAKNSIMNMENYKVTTVGILARFLSGQVYVGSNSRYNLTFLHISLMFLAKL